MRGTAIGTLFIRILQICFGLLVGLVVAEVLLQLAAFSTWSQRGTPLTGTIGSGRRIVFLGDSNTYGLGAGFENSFPQVLQRRWRQNRSQVQVFNLGTPGLNSSKLCQQLPEILMTLNPDTLVIMIGANDPWTAPAPAAGQAANWQYRLWNLSRVYRMLYMLSTLVERRTEIDRTIIRDAGVRINVGKDVDLEWTGRRPPGDIGLNWAAQLQENLRSIISEAHERGINTLLLTYPSGSTAYGSANSVIRDTAALTQTPVLDVNALFHDACPTDNCVDLFLPDQHPTPKGHEMVADTVWRYFSSGVSATPP